MLRAYAFFCLAFLVKVIHLSWSFSVKFLCSPRARVSFSLGTPVSPAHSKQEIRMNGSVFVSGTARQRVKTLYSPRFTLEWCVCMDEFSFVFINMMCPEQINCKIK